MTVILILVAPLLFFTSLTTENAISGKICLIEYIKNKLFDKYSYIYLLIYLFNLAYLIQIFYLQS